MSEPRKEVLAEGVEVWLGDCREVMPLLGRVDAIIADPPYGIGWTPRVNHKNQPWADVIEFDIRSILVGRFNLVWGGQYFSDKLPVSEGWLAWCKRPLETFSDDSRTYATIELAWRDWGKAKFISHVWDGGKRAGVADNRTFCHPSQKPVEVMEWCIRQLPTDAVTICDPFMGSGTTGVACVNRGCSFIGVEREAEYFDIARRRISEALRRPRLPLDEPAPQPRQEALL